MKILWLTLNPCYAIEKLSPETQSGGWLKALNYHIVEKENIELHVCFYWPKPLQPFVYHKTTYYPIASSGSKNILDKVYKKISKYDYCNDDLERILEVVHTINPDIIHVHGTELNHGLIQNRTSIPTVISIQGILSPYYEKYFSGVPEKFLKRNKDSGFAAFFKKINNAFRLNAERERKILKSTQHIIGRTDWDRRVTRLLAPKSRYFVGDEILREAFYGDETIWNKPHFESPLKLITTTGDVPYKGFELIVKTAKLLRDYGVEIRWDVVGLKENNLIPRAVKRWLKQDYKDLGIQFLGIKNERELVDVLLESDIYCQVSHIENSPNSLCEAMLIGMPIVATSVGGTSSMLKQNREGLLVQEGEPFEFAGAIIELQNNFEKAKTYGKNARESASVRHSASNIVRQLIDTYKSILQ